MATTTLLLLLLLLLLLPLVLLLPTALGRRVGLCRGVCSREHWYILALHSCQWMDLQALATGGARHSGEGGKIQYAT